jgi:hypothetical protein
MLLLVRVLPRLAGPIIVLTISPGTPAIGHIEQQELMVRQGPGGDGRDLAVDVEPTSGTSRLRLMIRDGDQLIGEYERTGEKDIERKKAEIASAAADLVKLFRKHGPFVVRWDGIERTKVVKDEFGNKIGEISKEHWHKPSWQNG